MSAFPLGGGVKYVIPIIRVRVRYNAHGLYASGLVDRLVVMASYLQ